MVFGKTYCAISRLPINDGDTCILFPLGFRMQSDFMIEPDLDFFTCLYTFVFEPIEVVFEGNYSAIKHASDFAYNKAGDEYKMHNLYMLVHRGFYDKIITEYRCPPFDTVKKIPSSETMSEIRNMAREIEQSKQTDIYIAVANGEITKEEGGKRFNSIPIPEWMQNICKVAFFMGQMGIVPYPNIGSDQRDTGDDYERFRKDFVVVTEEENP